MRLPRCSIYGPPSRERGTRKPDARARPFSTSSLSISGFFSLVHSLRSNAGATMGACLCFALYLGVSARAYIRYERGRLKINLSDGGKVEAKCVCVSLALCAMSVCDEAPFASQRCTLNARIKCALWRVSLWMHAWGNSRMIGLVSMICVCACVGML